MALPLKQSIMKKDNKKKKSVGKTVENPLKAVAAQPSPPVVITNRYKPIYHGKED